MINYSLEKYRKYDYQDICAHADGFKLPVNVYLPTLTNENNSCAVVCIHGGAWTSDLKKDSDWSGSWMKHTASLLASLGYIGIEITHRSITAVDMSDILSDIQCAFTYVNGVLKDRHDIKNVYAIGDSAGGHLALMSAFFECAELRPSKVVACNPVSDLTDPKWQLNRTSEHDRKRFSPLYFSDKTNTDIFIMHGDADKTVELSCSIKLNEHLSDLGCHSSLEVLSAAVHAFILYGYRTPIDHVNAYIEKVISFFASGN